MSIPYEAYARQSLIQTPITEYIGKWRVDYLAFSKPEHSEKTPLIVLGGAFQNFNSYKYCVEQVLEVCPVILVDLPSLGNNGQLAPELGIEDLADLLYQWVARTGLPKVHIMGLSLGSVVASTYAYKRPDRIEKLIVTGILPKPRKSWRMLLEESIKVLDEGRLDEFGQAVCSTSSTMPASRKPRSATSPARCSGGRCAASMKTTSTATASTCAG